MQSGNVPESGSIIITIWITGVSDVLPDSDVLRVLKSALFQALPPAPVCLSGYFCQQLCQSGLRMAENTLAES